jgi:hypothetical protein
VRRINGGDENEGGGKGWGKLGIEGMGYGMIR